MYSNPTLVRALTPLLTTEAISDTSILEFIYQAESILNLGLAKRYVTPITKDSNLTGTIASTASNSTITGTSTLFLTEVFPGDILYCIDKREAYKVSSIASNTSLTISTNALYTESSSSFFVLPREMVTASMYQAAMLIVLTHFSEQAYNQETGVFNTQYTMIAKNLIDVISRGEYLNTDLTEQVSTKSAARLVTVSISNDLREYIDDCQELIINDFPGV
jgi:hypothetical protein